MKLSLATYILFLGFLYLLVNNRKEREFWDVNGLKLETSQSRAVVYNSQVPGARFSKVPVTYRPDKQKKEEKPHKTQ